ncbi:MAG: NAD(P)H-hydrate dehydratase [Lachnospiraceae bacterium]|nr:NAD(P)H-hydrate dehydratase [Lachnospiraceae bacterium]
MKYALGSGQMKAIDRYTIEQIGIPALVLMEKAAMAVVRHTRELCSEKDNILAVCGYGNNGGDGIAAARILFMEGYSVAIYMVGEKERATKETKQQLKIAKKLGIPMIRKVKWEEYTVIIDAILGIGLTRPVAGDFRKIIEEMNQANKTVVSIDVPSGISADDGKVLGIAVNADVTVTFGYQKTGCLLFPGSEYAGKVFVEDIGFANGGLTAPPTRFYFDEAPEALLPVRKKNSNKGTYGKVLVIAGSKNMSGAAFFSATAAYRMGSGLVRILTAQENREILQRQIPEAILTTYETREEGITEQDAEAIREAVAWASVIVLGPGLGMSLMSARIVNYVICECKVPLVIDADGLNIIAKLVSEKVPEEEGVEGRIRYLAELLPAGTILTPHKKELSVLTGIPLADLVGCLIDSSASCTYNNELIYVKKDVRTIVSFGNSDYINVTGNDGMATAGSGDVLAGMIAGLLAQGESPKMAAMSGCYLHGMAGDVAAKKKGPRSMLASDILEAIPEVLQES